MYSAHIEHVMRHLHRMQAEVQSMIWGRTNVHHGSLTTA